MTFGDSFTFGLFVDTAFSYPSILENQLNNNLKCHTIKTFEVINLGVGAYDLQYSVERFRLHGLKYQPDLIIWLLNEWNIFRNNEITVPLVEKYEHSGIEKYNSMTGKYNSTIRADEEYKNLISHKDIEENDIKIFNQMQSLYYGPILLVSYNSLNKYSELIKYYQSLNPLFAFYEYVYDTWINPEDHLNDSHPSKKVYLKIARSLTEYLLSTCLNDDLF